MKTKISNLSTKLLNELQDIEFLDDINILLENLEIKVEPTQSEIYLTTLLYQVTEKLKLLEAHLREFSVDKNSMSNKLTTLYENCDGYGSSKLFKQ